MTDYDAEQSRQTAKIISYNFAQFKIHGTLLLIAVVFTVLVSKGMPLHSAAPVLGPIVALTALYLLIKVAQFGGVALSSWWLERDFRKNPKSLALKSSEYTYKPRSGRRRSRPD